MHRTDRCASKHSSSHIISFMSAAPHTTLGNHNTYLSRKRKALLEGCSPCLGLFLSYTDRRSSDGPAGDARSGRGRFLVYSVSNHVYISLFGQARPRRTPRVDWKISCRIDEYFYQPRYCVHVSRFHHHDAWLPLAIMADGPGLESPWPDVPAWSVNTT